MVEIIFHQKRSFLLGRLESSAKVGAWVAYSVAAVLHAAMLVFLATSCSQQPPPYESSYTPNPRAGLEPSVLPEATFVDNFDRPDTKFGLGEGWELRGPYAGRYPLPPATDGFIQDGTYTYAGDSVVYALRQFRGKVQRMGTIGRWRSLGEGSVETTLAMAISADDKLVSNMVHFAANRAVWKLTVRRGAGFEPVADGLFSPVLALDADHQFEVEVGDNSLTVRVPGADDVTRDVDLSDVTGERAFWEEYAEPMPANVVFDFETVWAAEAGYELKPVNRQ